MGQFILSFAFDGKLDILGFEGTGKGLRPSSKHRDKVKNWAIPTNREDLDSFLWLIPFLRIFIPGRADHVMVLKEAYLKKVSAQAKIIKQHHNELEKCDLDLAKAHRSTMKPKKPTICRTYKEKGIFDWGPRQKASFHTIKNAITNNVVAKVDPNLQFHLLVDASQTSIGGILFQMKGVKPGTEASTKFAGNERIVIFLFYCLTDAETRYGNSERECLVVVRCLTEIKWLVANNSYEILIYLDHHALQDIFSKGDSEKARINAWLDRFSEFDLRLVHRPSRDQHIGLADGLSRMPTTKIDGRA